MSRELSKDKTQMSEKQSSASLVVREMQIKISLRFHFASLRMVKVIPLCFHRGSRDANACPHVCIESTLRLLPTPLTNSFRLVHFIFVYSIMFYYIVLFIPFDSKLYSQFLSHYNSYSPLENWSLLFNNIFCVAKRVQNFYYTGEKVQEFYCLIRLL